MPSKRDPTRVKRAPTRWNHAVASAYRAVKHQYPGLKGKGLKDMALRQARANYIPSAPRMRKGPRPKGAPRKKRSDAGKKRGPRASKALVPYGYAF